MITRRVSQSSLHKKWHWHPHHVRAFRHFDLKGAKYLASSNVPYRAGAL